MSRVDEKRTTTMGIFDFVKSGVQRMTIARPDPANEAVVYKHLDQNFSFWTQLTVDTDEVALFFTDGRDVGTLSPGRHTLDPLNFPFLGALLDKVIGGNVFISELYFVTTRALYNQTLGGPIGPIRDPELEIRVNPRASGTYAFCVVEPSVFTSEFIRQTGVTDPDRAMQWVRDQVMMGVRTTLTSLLRDGAMTMMDFGTAGPDVARAIVRNCPDVSRIGVAVLEVAKLDLSLSDEEQKRVDQFQDQSVQAKIDARTAKIGLGRVEAEVRAEHLRAQQVFAKRAQYMNQFDVQRFRPVAAAETSMGLGRCLAQGEGGAGTLAGVGAAIASKMAMGQGFRTDIRRRTHLSIQGRPTMGWRLVHRKGTRLAPIYPATRCAASRLPGSTGARRRTKRVPLLPHPLQPSPPQCRLRPSTALNLVPLTRALHVFAPTVDSLRRGDAVLLVKHYSVKRPSVDLPQIRQGPAQKR